MFRTSLVKASRNASTAFSSSSRCLSSPLRCTTSATRLSALRPSTTRIAARWYSDAAEAKKPEDGADKATPPQGEDAKADSSELEKLKAELATKNKEVLDFKDRYLRSVADYRNLQERTKREAQAARDFALQKFAKDLVAPIDNFEHALGSVTAEKLASPPSTATAEDVQSLHKDLVALHDGVKMIETVLVGTLEKHGLVRFDPSEKSEKFDPNIHEAVFMSPMAGKEDGTVFHTTQKGFMLNGRVIRAPKVGVVKNS